MKRVHCSSIRIQHVPVLLRYGAWPTVIIEQLINEKSNYYGPSSCSEEKASNLVSLDEKDEVPDISLHMKSHTESENLSAECPISLPTFTKPVSAMKGSREKVGIPLKKLSVTWAPDVYDPPCNSISHMVKSHSSQRSRNKKDSKHRHKGKSSQGSNSSKRYKKHAGKTDYRLKSSPTSVRLSYPCSARLLYGDYNQTKFGSSFLRTSLAEVHVTVAEAT
ncbi:hypothetical protein IFM89_016448 [Coptis chinensis]|uniref:Uncharacterized protein n=1 Tax=Coptis chinensis TaxID=261450 RepID=A0A835LIR5_9MAGN|nr:hypothetical protein IFM89_016448 [Coptis chinensis]